ncbi:MAG TPA: M20/M25/M40 family metallo-hydrolase [Nocardioides sp.]|jgi:acetylornithine deacetylase|uniref:M20/M25/M40 family metallo-hydrolase n=1 Tax=Nocardioides sp. TaxID=35761 RepID=UPI002E32E158|nr:M20/M25/M40 family metallo-hydrolase [Nocardioides sp.]HEX3930765.1 M20/M25/M40 family metallo-hydrolase [Nocardioides sp.]
MTVTSDDVVALVSDLVRIESVTPWLVPGGAGEAEVARYLADWLSDLPVDVVVDEIAPGRTNLVATLRGTGGGPTLCLNAHADTVGFEGWPDDALQPRVDGDRLYGLGAADDKGCCAAALLAMRELAGTPLRGDLVVACVADEEGVSIGTERLVQQLRADAAVVLEPDALPRLVVEHQGFGWIDVVVHGRAAHGSAPDDGIDAIVAMADIVTRLHRQDVEVFAAHPDPLNGRTVFHTGTVRGGTDYATYPSLCTLGIEIGTQTGERLDDRVAEIEAMIDDVRRDVPELAAEVVVRLEREPFVARGHEPLLACLDRAAERTLGGRLTPSGLNAWTDAALMQNAGIPTLLLGPLGGNFHAPDEWLSISETVSVVDLLVVAAREYLG